MTKNTFFLCPGHNGKTCGKMHTYGGLSAVSRCPKCGYRLLDFVCMAGR